MITVTISRTYRRRRGGLRSPARGQFGLQLPAAAEMPPMVAAARIRVPSIWIDDDTGSVGEGVNYHQLRQQLDRDSFGVSA